MSEDLLSSISSQSSLPSEEGTQEVELQSQFENLFENLAQAKSNAEYETGGKAFGPSSRLTRSTEYGEDEDVKRGFSSTISSAKGAYNALGAAFSEMVGDPLAAEEYKEDAIKNYEDAAKNAPRITDIADIESGGDMLDWAQGALGQIAYAGGALAVDLASGGAAKVVKTAVIKPVLKRVSKDLKKDAVKKQLVDLGLPVESLTDKQVNRAVATTIAQKAAEKTKGFVPAAKMAAVTSAFVGLETGQNAWDIYLENGKLDGETLGTAFKYGLPAGALNLPGYYIAKGMIKRPTGLKGDFKSNGARVADVIKKAGLGAAAEVPQEMVQEALNIFAVKDATGDSSPFTKEEYHRLLNAGATALVASTVLSGGIATAKNLRERKRAAKAENFERNAQQGAAELEAQMKEMLGETPDLSREPSETVVVDEAGNAEAPPVNPEPGIDEQGDATFGVDVPTDSRAARKVAEKAGMGGIFNTSESPVNAANEDTPDPDVELTPETNPEVKRLPAPEAKVVEMNVEFPIDDQGKTVVKDESGETLELSGRTAQAYKKLRQMTPKFAQGLLSTKQAISNAVAIVNNAGIPDSIEVEKVRNATKRIQNARREGTEVLQSDLDYVKNIVAQYKRGGAGDVYRRGLRNKATQIIDSVDQKRGKNQEVSLEEAAEYKEAKQFLENTQAMEEEVRGMGDNIDPLRARGTIEPEYNGDPDVEQTYEGPEDRSAVDNFDGSVNIPNPNKPSEISIIGRNPVTGNRILNAQQDAGTRQRNKVDVSDWNRPFATNKQAHHQVGRLENPSFKDYNNPADARLREVYPPDNHVFDVRAVDENGNLLPKKIDSKSNKIAGYIVTATPLTQTAGLGSPATLSDRVLGMLEQALDFGQLYVSQRGKYKEAYKNTLSFNVVAEVTINKVGGGLYATESSAKQALTRWENQKPEKGKRLFGKIPTDSNPENDLTTGHNFTKREDYKIVEVTDEEGNSGWKITTTKKVKRHVYLPSLMWTGKLIIQQTVDPSFSIGGDGSGALEALSAGLQGLQQYQELQGVKIDPLTKLNVTVDKKGKWHRGKFDSSPLFTINGKTFNFSDVARKATAPEREIAPTLVEYSEERLNQAETERKQQADEAIWDPRDPMNKDQVDTAYVDDIIKKHVLPGLANMLGWANNQISFGGKQAGKGRAEEYTRAIINTVFNAAFDPMVSVLFGRPSPSLLSDPKASRDRLNENDLATTKAYEEWQAKVTEHLRKRVPELVRQKMLAWAEYDGDPNNDYRRIITLKDLNVIEFYLNDFGHGNDTTIIEFVKEALTELSPEINRDIVSKETKYMGLIPALKQHKPGTIHKYPKTINHPIAKIEGITAGVRAYGAELMEAALIPQKVSFQTVTTKDRIDASKRQEVDPSEQELDPTYYIEGREDFGATNAGQANPETRVGMGPNDASSLQMRDQAQTRAKEKTPRETNDTFYLQEAMDAVADAASQRSEGNTAPPVNLTPDEVIQSERIWEQEVEGKSEPSINDTDPRDVTFIFNPKYVSGISDGGAVTYYGSDEFVKSNLTDVLFNLAQWAHKTFALNSSKEDQQIIFVDQTGLDALIAANPVHADYLQNINKSFKSSTPFRSVYDKGYPTVILVNKDYQYTKSNGESHSYYKIKNPSSFSDPVTAFGHELGHIVFDNWRSTMPKALRTRLQKEYDAAVPNERKETYTLDEWMADQFALYVKSVATDEGRTKQAPPHWKQLFAAIKKIYDKVNTLLKAVIYRTGGPSESYHNFLQTIANEEGIKQRAHRWYRQQIRAGVDPEKAVAVAKLNMEKAFVKAGLKNPKTTFKDAPRQGRVTPEESANEQVDKSAKAAKKDSTLPPNTGEIIEDAQRSSFFGEQEDARRRAESWVDNLFADNPKSVNNLSRWLGKADAALASVQYRLAEIPGGRAIGDLIRQRPGDKATGQGTTEAAQRHYYNKWYKAMSPLRKRKGESKQDFQNRINEIQTEIASGKPFSEDAKIVANGLRNFAQWMTTKQQAARDSSLNRDKRNGKATLAPQDDKTILRFLESWNMPHNYVIDQLITQEGRQRFFELLDKYQKADFFKENKTASEEDWVAFREYIFKKITNSEGLITNDFADNLRFNNSRSRILRNIPTWELLGRNGEPTLIDNQFDNAIRNYLHDGARQVAWEERFGGYEQKPDTGEWHWNANRVIKDWHEGLKTADRASGLDYSSEARDLINVLQGRSNRQLSAKGRMYSNVATAAMNMLHLAWAVMASFPDLAGPAMRADGQYKGLLKAIGSSARAAWGSDPEGLLEQAETLGIASEHILQHAFIETGSSAFDNYSSGKYQTVMKAQEGFFKLIQLEAWTNFTRVLAMQTGNSYLDNAYADIQMEKAHPGNYSEQAANAQQAFLELGLTPEEWMAIRKMRNGKEPDSQFTQYLEEKEAMVMNKFVDESIMRPSAMIKPAWHSDPRWQTVAHLKSYFWYMQATYWPRIFKQFDLQRTPEGYTLDVNGKAAAKLIGAGMMMLPLAMLGLATRDSLYYAFSDSEPPERDMLDLIGRTGALGAYTIGLEFADTWEERGMSGEMIARNIGPLWGHAYGAVTQHPSTTLSKSVPGLSWFRATKDAIKSSSTGFNDEIIGRQ